MKTLLLENLTNALLLACHKPCTKDTGLLFKGLDSVPFQNSATIDADFHSSGRLPVSEHLTNNCVTASTKLSS